MRHLAVVSALLVAGALPAAAQDARYARLPAAARADVVMLIDSAHALGLPREPVLQRALQGSARGAPAARIVAAVRAYIAQLGAAQTLVGSADESALLAAASALQAGVPADDVRRIAQSTPHTVLPVALVALVDIVQRGVPQAIAAESVAQLAAAGARAEAFAFLRSSVAQDIGAGAEPGASARTRTRGLLRGGPPHRDQP